MNFAFVYHHEAYPDFKPPFEFLFVPRMAPLLAHSRALLTGDYRVDMWLVNVYRSFGVARFVALALPLFAILALCGWRLGRSLNGAFATWESGIPPAFVCRPWPVIGALVFVCAATGFGLALDPSRGPSRAALAVPGPGKAPAERDLMQSGLDLLYRRQQPDAAAEQFRSVLAHNPTHYGATFQLAMALDRAGEDDGSAPDVAGGAPDGRALQRRADRGNGAGQAGRCALVPSGADDPREVVAADAAATRIAHDILRVGPDLEHLEPVLAEVPEARK